MELRLLQYFLAVAKEGSISSAADVLHLTQPTLSRQMMDLESELQTKLFIRGNRKITLTESGILLRKRAREIMELVEKTESEISVNEKTISGDIYIGGGETYSMRLIAEIIKEIQKEYPQIRIHIYSGNADDVTERLDKGLIDFGVLIDPTNIKKYDFLPLPAVDNWGVLMRKDSILADKIKIEPEDLWNLPLITSRQTLVNTEISNWIKKDYENLNIVATYNLVYNASLLVNQGIGYALSLDKLINTTGDSNFCFRPLSPGLEAKLNIVWKKQQVFSKPATLFLEKIMIAFSES